jgi:hypothetical protein
MIERFTKVFLLENRLLLGFEKGCLILSPIFVTSLTTEPKFLRFGKKSNRQKSLSALPSIGMSCLTISTHIYQRFFLLLQSITISFVNFTSFLFDSGGLSLLNLLLTLLSFLIPKLSKPHDTHECYIGQFPCLQATSAKIMTERH